MTRAEYLPLMVARDAPIRVLDVPIVEGGVAAAVAAESGADLDAVARAASGGAGEQPDEPAPPPATSDGSTVATVALADPEGLHARPAAALVRLVARFDARVTVNGADASSLLRVIALGLRHGEQVTVRAEGAQAAEAVDAVAELLRGPAA